MKRFSNVPLPKIKGSIGIDDYQFHDRIANFGFILAFIIAFISFYFVFRNMSALPPQVPFFFSERWGVSRLAPTTYLWFVPGGLFVFFLANYAIALFIQKQVLLLARILGILSAVLAIGSLYVVWNIVSLVIRPIV